MMLFCAVLGVRKKLPTWRIGSAAWWMRAHIWLGLLSVPMILFHCGFDFGGTLTTALMYLFFIVIASGVHGVVIQNMLPRIMTNQVATETIYEQIPHVIDQLRAEAVETVESVCGPIFPEPLTVPDAPVGEPAPGAPKPKPKPKAKAAVAVEGSQPLKDFYFQHLESFLGSGRLGEQDMATPARAQALFAHMRKIVPPAVQDAVSHIEEICDERRQLDTQTSLHHWMHGWLFIHIPLSAALVLLGVVHAIFAFLY